MDHQVNTSPILSGEHALRHRTWAEINLDAIENNFRLVQKGIGNCKICCIIKANAYGHGAIMLARLYEQLGAGYLAVSNIEEALQLRQNGIHTPILVLGYTPALCADLLAQNQITQCVYSAEYGYHLAEAALHSGVTVKIHIKLDTGMGRIGFLCRDDSYSELEQIVSVCHESSLEPEGLFTHFSSADSGEDNEETRLQMERFQKAESFLKDKGLTFPICHCANSAGILSYPDSHMDMVRAGIILYGCMPSEVMEPLDGLIPAMTVRSVISHVKELQPGESVSYGQTFKAKKAMKIATIPIGYADGFWRSAGNGKYSFLINGKMAPIVGRVCMDQVMVDVTHIPCVTGDLVTIFGTEPGCRADDLAKAANTISYEVLCGVGGRVPRAYTKDGQIVAWTDLLYDSDLRTSDS